MLGQEWLFNCVCAYFFVLPEEGVDFCCCLGTVVFCWWGMFVCIQ